MRCLFLSRRLDSRLSSRLGQVFTVASLLLSGHLALAAPEETASAPPVRPTGVISDPASTSALRQAVEAVTAMKSYLPSQKARCVIDRLMEVIQPDEYVIDPTSEKDLKSKGSVTDRTVGSSNKGLENYYGNLEFNNSCFKNRLRNFWLAAHQKSKPNDFSTDRPNISEKAGEGRFSHLKPGWLWQDALVAAKGDQNLAMVFVGICGNDDVNHAHHYNPPDHEIRDNLRDRRDNLKRQIASIRQNSSGLESNSQQFQILQDRVQDLQTELTKIDSDLAWKKIPRNGSWECPTMNTGVYAPRSLDASMDLPDDMKNAIIKDQRPKGNVTNLAAKAYHFTGGAISGCQLARCGLSPETASKVSGLVAMMYRAIRLCPTIKQDLLDLQRWEARIKAPANSPEFEAQMMAKLGPKGVNRLREYDAATLFSQWYLGGPKMSAPCTGIRWRGPEDLNAAEPAGRSLCGIEGWSAERCANARKKLYNWDLDIQWTQKQHEIGARFGASKCSEWTPATSINKICPSGETGVEPVQETTTRTVK